MVSNDADPVRRSVEVEYWVVDSEGELTEPGDLTDAAPGAEREFVEPLLEIKTEPCETTAGLREQLLDRLESVLEAAERTGKGLVPLATPIHAEEIAELPEDRTWIQNEVVGEDFEYVRHCAGTHVHVEQQPGRVADQINTLIALDPALALLNSSPYYQGEVIAAGARSKLYRRMAYDSLPHQGRLWRYVEDLEAWDRRLTRRYEEFVVRAMDAGVDRRAIVANFEPESAVWTPVQPRATFGTVEWRSPDAALPSQVLDVADRIAGLVEHLRDAEVRIEGDVGRVTADAILLPEFDALLEYLEAAIEEGLESTAVRSYLDRMGFDVDSVEPLVHEIDATEPVSPAEAREQRLAYADRLRRDVRARSAFADD